MNLIDLTESELRLFAMETLLRRISLINKPYVLKGSMLSKQYITNENMRQADDLDFLYTGEKFNSPDESEKSFTDWMTQVTNLDAKDGVVFDDFSSSFGWDNISYAMWEDFPTVSADIFYKIFDKSENFLYRSFVSVDVSFNLEMEVPPISIAYNSRFLGSFPVPYTAPLSVQVAWKLHQSIVRPRFKDLYDLSLLLAHPSYDEKALKDTLHTLAKECSYNHSITKRNIEKVLAEDLQNLFPLFERWDEELHKQAATAKMEKNKYYQMFAPQLRKIMDQAGINRTAFDNFPYTD